ncbi:MAG: formate dehydrogenase accessory protein FdhE [Actinomycetota bacterium]|nr:formate dehydrogenase accessory protein FdhE [Actinomycetota bacterium]
MRRHHGAPGDFEHRLARTKAIARSPATAEPLAFIAEVLGVQRDRAANPEVKAAAARVSAESKPNRLVGNFPMLELAAGVEPIRAEVDLMIDGSSRVLLKAPGPLRDAAADLSHESSSGLSHIITTWLDDPSLLDPRHEVWIRISGGPILELAAAGVEPLSRDEWAGRACPLCGDLAQAAVIVEESGGFLQGSPRYLVCRRCAGWWAYPRAVCPSCGEDDSRRISSYSPDGQRWVRVDVCDNCRTYVKTFDLREPEASEVDPLVDDVATLTLDVWAHERGLQRFSPSLAGV